MADSEKTLQIIIEFQAKLAGAQASLAALQEMRRQAIAMGVSTKELDAEIAASEQTLQKLNKTIPEQNEHVEKLVGNKREWLHIIRALGGEAIPEMGHALTTAIYGSGAIAGIFALVGAFQYLKRITTDYYTNLNTMAEKGAQADFLPGIEAKLGMMREALDAQDSYLASLEKARTGEHGIAQELAAQLQLQAALTAARSSQAEAEKTLAIANLTQRKAFGQISDADFIIGKGDIEKKFLRDKATAEDKAKQDAINAATQAAAAGQGDQPSLDAKAKDARDAANAEKMRRQRIEQSGNLITEDDYKKAQQKLTDSFGIWSRASLGKDPGAASAMSLDELRAQREKYSDAKANPEERKDYEKARDEVDELIKARETTNFFEAARRQRLTPDKTAALNKAASEAEAAALKNQNETTAAAEKAKADRDIQDATREATEKARRAQESTINANTASELIKTPLGQTAFSAAGTADKVLAHASNIEQGSLQQLNDLVKFLGGTAANQSQILGLISRANDSIAGAQTLIGAIERRQSELEKNHRDLKSQVSHL